MAGIGGSSLAHRLRTVSPRVVDIGIAVLVQLAVTVPFVVERPVGAPPATWSAYLMTTLAVVPLVWRRRAPMTVLLATVALALGYSFVDGPGQPLPYAGLIALYTVAVLATPWQRAATLVVAVPAIAIGVWLNTNTVRELLFTSITAISAYVLGALTRTRQAYTAAIEDRARRLERDREIEAERAAARERARLAREMHDILSHAVSLMIVQAEAGPVAVRNAPERAEAAFDAIASAGRDAMAQLRRMLGVLRETAPGDEPDDAGRAPQPTVAAVPALVEQVRRAGLPVELTTTGTPRPLPADTQASVYRVIQEALTNVLKHAHASQVEVRLDWAPDALDVRVLDNGRGLPPTPSEGRSGGHGLVGIHERVAAHGGQVRVGPGPDGRGVMIHVKLPMPDAPRAGR
ncbi:sensor histidine kinase [Goodfellowiella coeruleoviolacea]|uniref:histidine kinase n=1 Tax=Goodfellowiella coeruleoviolacea TaxID=334858 RepID=A0AAE3KPH7_9PSEU|nr:histidine kinase [Goodfellowiella coeruleoviolacea]MCP2169868.1 Signal transduction histidine kinase [Goodfellowiella coeruleoviolacea]